MAIGLLAGLQGGIDEINKGKDQGVAAMGGADAIAQGEIQTAQAVAANPGNFNIPNFQTTVDAANAYNKVDIAVGDDGRIKVDLPEFLYDTKIFKDQMDKLAQIPVQNGGDGTLLHPLLEKDNIDGINSYANQLKERFDAASQYASQKGYNREQAKSIYDSLVDPDEKAKRSFKGFSLVDPEKKKLLGQEWLADGLIGATELASFGLLDGTDTTHKVDLNRDISLTEKEFVDQFKGMTSEFKKEYIRKLEEKVKGGDAASALSMFALEKNGAFNGDLSDFVEGANNRFYGTIASIPSNAVSGVSSLVNLVTPGDPLGGVQQSAADVSKGIENAFIDREYTDLGKAGDFAGRIAAIPVELAIAAKTPAAIAKIGSTLGAAKEAALAGAIPASVAGRARQADVMASNVGAKLGNISNAFKSAHPNMSKFLFNKDDLITGTAFTLGSSDPSNSDLVGELGINLASGLALAGGARTIGTAKKVLNARTEKMAEDALGDLPMVTNSIVDAMNDASIGIDISKIGKIDSNTGTVETSFDTVKDIASKNVQDDLQGIEQFMQSATELGAASIKKNLGDYDLSGQQLIDLSRAYESGDGALVNTILQDAGTTTYDSIGKVQQELFKLIKKSGGKISKLDNHLSRARWYNGADTITDTYARSSNKKAAQQNERKYLSIDDVMKEYGSVPGDVDLLNNAVADLSAGIAARTRDSVAKGMVSRGTIIKVDDKLGDGVVKIITKNGKTSKFIANSNTLKNNGFELIKNDKVSKLIQGNMPDKYKSAYYASSKNIDLLNRFFAEDQFSATKLDNALSNMASVSKAWQNLTLAGGIPGTPMNIFATREIINSIMAGNIKGALESWGRAFSKEATEQYFLSNMKYALKASQHGLRLLPEGILGDSARAAVRVGDETYESVDDLVESNWFKTMMSQMNIKDQDKIMNAVKNVYGKVDDGLAAATFDRMLPVLQTNAFKQQYLKNIKAGYSDYEAAGLASRAVRNFYQPQQLSRKAMEIVSKSGSKRGDDILSIVVMAPQYRKSTILRMADSIYALSNVKQLAGKNRDQFIREHALNIRWGLSVIAGLLAIEAYTYTTQQEHIFGRDIPFDSLRLGKVGGYDADYQLLGPTATIPRTLGRMFEALNNNVDNTERVKDVIGQVVGLSSVMLQPMLRVLLDSNFAGSSIQNPFNDPTLTSDEKTKNVVDFLKTSYAGHPYVRALVEWEKGNGLDAVTIAGEVPINLRRLDKTANALFNNDVIPKAQYILEQYESEIVKNIDNPEEVSRLKTEAAKRIKSELVGPWIKKYGRELGIDNASELPDKMSDRLLNIIQDTNILQMPKGTYEGQEKTEAYYVDKVLAKEMGKSIGLDLSPTSDAFEDIYNKSRGAPARMQFEFESAIKGDKEKNIESMNDIFSKYQDMINDAYKIKDYASVDNLKNEYNSILASRLQPLIDKNGGDSIARNSKLLDTLDNIIMVPSEYMQDKSGRNLSSSKYPNMDKERAFKRNYLEDWIGVGPNNTSNIPSDEEIKAGIQSIQNKLDTGRRSSANVEYKALNKRIDAGRLYADEYDAEALYNLRRAL